MGIEVSYHEAGARLEWLVRQFEILNCNSDADFADKFIPRFDIALVFHFGTPPLMLQPVNGPLPPYFLAPIITKSSLMRINKSNNTFVVTCKPTVFSRILHLDLSPEPHLYIPLPHEPFFMLWKNLQSKTSAEERIACFAHFIETVHPETYQPDAIDAIYEKIIASTASDQLSHLLEGFSFGARTLQRQFQKRLGITPKKLMRIVRINHIWERIQTNPEIDYQDLIFEGNYFDQTHFIKDFKAITGETPDAFFKRDLSYVKMLSGKQ